MDPSFISASKRNLTGDAFNNFVESLKNEYEEKKKN
jgi:hypothetical protein